MARAVGLGDAAAAQVEQLLGVQLADRRAVAALHVVGVDLELRLAVDLGLRATAAAPGSSGSRRSSARRAPPRSCPGTRRATRPVSTFFTVWRRGAVRRVVRHHGGDVAVLRRRRAVAPVQVRRGAAPGEPRVHFGARQPRRPASGRSCHRCRAAATSAYSGARRGTPRGPRPASADASSVAPSADRRSRRPDCAGRRPRRRAISISVSRAPAPRRIAWRGWKATGRSRVPPAAEAHQQQRARVDAGRRRRAAAPSSASMVFSATSGSRSGCASGAIGRRRRRRGRRRRGSVGQIRAEAAVDEHQARRVERGSARQQDRRSRPRGVSGSAKRVSPAGAGWCSARPRRASAGQAARRGTPRPPASRSAPRSPGRRSRRPS